MKLLSIHRFLRSKLSLTDILQFRCGFGKLFLLRLGGLGPVGLVPSAALAGLAAPDLLPTTRVVHGGRRHVLLGVLVGFLASQVVALSVSQAKNDVFMFPVSAVKVRVAASAAPIYEPTQARLLRTPALYSPRNYVTDKRPCL